VLLTCAHLSLSLSLHLHGCLCRLLGVLTALPLGCTLGSSLWLNVTNIEYYTHTHTHTHTNTYTEILMLMFLRYMPVLSRSFKRTRPGGDVKGWRRVMYKKYI
jgi:hypothetical protein